MNKFDQLLDDLKEGKLNLTHIQIAYRAYLREGKDVPDPIKDMLGGRGEAYSGVIYSIFKLVKEVEGTVELAYGRGYQAGKEDREQDYQQALVVAAEFREEVLKLEKDLEIKQEMLEMAQKESR